MLADGLGLEARKAGQFAHIFVAHEVQLPDEAQFAGQPRAGVGKHVPYAHRLMVGAQGRGHHPLLPVHPAKSVPDGLIAPRLGLFDERPLEHAHAVQAGVLDHAPAILLPAWPTLPVGAALQQLIGDDLLHSRRPLFGNANTYRSRVQLGVCLPQRVRLEPLYRPHVGDDVPRLQFGQLRAHDLLHPRREFLPQFRHDHILGQQGIGRGVDAPILALLGEQQVHQSRDQRVHLLGGEPVVHL